MLSRQVIYYMNHTHKPFLALFFQGLGRSHMFFLLQHYRCMHSVDLPAIELRRLQTCQCLVLSVHQICSQTMEATPGSQSGESCALDLPSACDLRDYMLQRPSQEANNEALSSVEVHSFPYSSDVDPDSSNLNSEQKNSWTSEDLWPDPSLKDQAETNEEDAGLRKSLDRFYEVFGHPQPASGNPLSAFVCQHLSEKIPELRDQESQKYALRSFQMAQVIFNRDGYSALQRHSKHAHFYPLGAADISLDDEEPIPGLSKDIICYLLKHCVMTDP
ncbi:shieldin complex subunit 1 isoform X1 [Dipodomys merriami]|uniref:shieldin complex subunit 1 isoform X1 n=2 Tax=Dipodomys merriami TaxID=94247 RepID=UPI003855707B